ncbi:hypothetical protein [Nocardioides campestrisoli]|uniref:hypothetical protein n=1 Tax=Nocardioides campestrisoli TaxID=2736757 RepID=UPI0015E77334|nr:hypothetical protein [Nocardioides campestrisoli]
MTTPVTDEFVRRVQAATEGTPYVVKRTSSGFDLTLDVADAQWFGLFNRAGLKKVFVHHVKVTPETFSITDESTEVRWEAGHPRVAASATKTMGRSIEFGHEKIWAIRDDGTVGRVVDYRFDSEEGRDLITLVGKDLGLSSRAGGAEKIGLYAALSVPVLLVLGLLLVLVLWLTGQI